ncbi:hypothetical protein [Calothrix sp. NIES-3974]|uniref:hypothetical protein n=1 Tax=Calothrix sp. NIES-3974 TaxID=2005462 RepID=UPI0012FD5043|nr:hypothetical protein [Calothrix sp. NIES-3974]
MSVANQVSKSAMLLDAVITAIADYSRTNESGFSPPPTHSIDKGVANKSQRMFVKY